MREPCFFFYCYARLQRYYKSCLLAVELLLVTIPPQPKMRFPAVFFNLVVSVINQKV